MEVNLSLTSNEYFALMSAMYKVLTDNSVSEHTTEVLVELEKNISSKVSVK